MRCIHILLLYALIKNEINGLPSSDTYTEELKIDLSPELKTEMCTNSSCIYKCCPFGKFIKRNTKNESYVTECVPYNSSRNLSSFNDNGIFKSFTDMSKFHIVDGIYEKSETLTSTNSVTFPKDTVMHLEENAEVRIDTPNGYKQSSYVRNDMYCLDYIIVEKDNITTIEPGVQIVYEFADYQIETEEIVDVMMSCGLLVSCFFLMLLLVVYALLWELRNLCGRILMAYVASLFAAFLFLASMRFMTINDDTDVNILCISLTLCTYYLLLASFCWMNVMSYDIWWTFRGYALARPIHRRGEPFKFSMYCLYAWGLPLAMTIMLGVLNDQDMTHVPWFVTPKIPSNGCFLEGGEKLLYLFIPMLVMITCNWIFYIMTAYSMWRLSRNTAILDSSSGTSLAHRTNKQRFMVYLKLSIVMGLNWVLEVMSYFYPSSKILLISDIYNILIGFSIFLIFVCKRSILKKLIKRFRRYKKTRQSPVQTSESRSSCDSSIQETQMLQICLNPKGPEYDF